MIKLYIIMRKIIKIILKCLFVYNLKNRINNLQNIAESFKV